jgi:hypothetical protein
VLILLLLLLPRDADDEVMTEPPEYGVDWTEAVRWLGTVVTDWIIVVIVGRLDIMGSLDIVVGLDIIGRLGRGIAPAP